MSNSSKVVTLLRYSFLLVSIAIGAIVFFDFSPMKFYLGFKSDYKSKQKIDVLFIGNSYTTFNEMPEIVSSLSKISKGSDYYIEAESVVAGGATLEYHWKGNNALQALKSKNWDYVVFQGQSFTMMFSERMKSFDIYLGKFVNEIKKSTPETKVILFSTWPRQRGHSLYAKLGFGYNDMLDTVQKNYHYYASKYKLDVLYTGSYFYNVNKNGYDTYSDGSHPNLMGSYLVALLFYKKFIPGANTSCEDVGLIYDIKQKECEAINAVVNS